MRALSVLLAFALDLALGDPRLRWHPVRLLGGVIQGAERVARRAFRDEFWGGVALAGGMVLLVSGADLCLMGALSTGLGGWARQAGLLAASSLAIYFCLSIRDLGDHVLAVVRAIEAAEARRDPGDLWEPRRRVARIVGRDTGDLDRQGVLRACLESLAESTCDGVVAPLFYAVLGGAPLALAHKTLSTLDSMVGYRNDRYRLLGRASARLDDWMNWVPARLTVLLAALAAWCLGLDGRQAVRTAWRDGPGQPSPNSGFPEGAFAGALGVQLGGPVRYQGRLVEKARLGEPMQVLDLKHLRLGLALMYATALLALGLFLAVWALIFFRA